MLHLYNGDEIINSQKSRLGQEMFVSLHSICYASIKKRKKDIYLPVEILHLSVRKENHLTLFNIFVLKYKYNQSYIRITAKRNLLKANSGYTDKKIKCNLYVFLTDRNFCIYLTTFLLYVSNLFKNCLTAY